MAAAKARKKIPFWAMATLSTLPLWAFMYVRASRPPRRRSPVRSATAPRSYTGCASCHGADGDGGVGYAFADGEVLKTFPHIEDQLRWVYSGTEAYIAAGVEIYGDPDREGGAARHQGARRHAAGASSAARSPRREILAVVCHERYTLGGADPTSADQKEFDDLVRRRLAGVRRHWRTARRRSTTSTTKVDRRADQGSAHAEPSRPAAGSTGTLT